jgi:hypothetical protein
MDATDIRKYPLLPIFNPCLFSSNLCNYLFTTCNRKLGEGVRRMTEEQTSKPYEIRFNNIVGMGLDFSSMIGLFEKGSFN